MPTPANLQRGLKKVANFEALGSERRRLENMKRLFKKQQNQYNKLKLVSRDPWLASRAQKYEQRRADTLQRLPNFNFPKFHSYLVRNINRSSNNLEKNKIKKEISKITNIQSLKNIQHFYKNFPNIKKFIQHRIEGISYSRKGFPSMNTIKRYTPGRVRGSPLTVQQLARSIFASRGLGPNLIRKIEV